MAIEEHSDQSTIPVDGVITSSKPIEPSVSDRGVEDIGLRDAAQDLGARIKAARESANMSVEAAGELLKLVPEIIVALESGEIVDTGGKRLIYVEGYYRAYANALGIDVGDTRFAIDHARPIETSASLSPQINYQATAKQVLTERLRERSDAIIFGLVAVMVAVVGGVIWLVWPSTDDLVGSTATGVIVAPSDPPQTQSPGGEIPFYLRDEQEQPTDIESPMLVANPASDEASDVLDVSEDQSEELEVASEEEVDLEGNLATAQSVVESTDAISEFNVVPGTEEAIPDTGVIEITFAGRSWVEVYGADDVRLYYGMGQAGDVASLVGVTPFTVRIGDTSVVKVRFNEAEIDLAPYTFGNVANLTIQ